MSGLLRASMASAFASAFAFALAACDGDDAQACAGRGCARDSGMLDARAPGGDAAADAQAPRDGAAGDAAAPQHSECTTAADCAVPDALLACETCQDGSERCPEVVCQSNFCAARFAGACPELEPVLACSSDADCGRRPCAVKCQGDGRDACLRGACSAGVCSRVVSTCGLQIEQCPEGTRAAVECGTCEADGGCAFEVLGCFQSCARDADCPPGQPCSEGVCQFAPECA